MLSYARYLIKGTLYKNIPWALDDMFAHYISICKREPYFVYTQGGSQKGTIAARRSQNKDPTEEFIDE